MLPQTNARLVKVERTGGSLATGWTEDYDRAATDPETAGGEGADLWVGDRAAYWIERRRRVPEGQSSRVIVERTLLLEPHLPEVSFLEGDQVTVEHGGASKRGQVAAVELREIPETGLRSLRLTMEDA